MNSIAQSAREAKAVALAAVLRAGEITAELIAEITTAQWKLLADIAGVEPPHSEATTDIIRTWLYGGLTAEKLCYVKTACLAIRQGRYLRYRYPVSFVRLVSGAWPDPDQIVEACLERFASARTLKVSEDEMIVLATMPRREWK